MSGGLAFLGGFVGAANRKMAADAEDTRWKDRLAFLKATELSNWKVQSGEEQRIRKEDNEWTYQKKVARETEDMERMTKQLHEEGMDPDQARSLATMSKGDFGKMADIQTKMKWWPSKDPKKKGSYVANSMYDYNRQQEQLGEFVKQYNLNDVRDAETIAQLKYHLSNGGKLNDFHMDVDPMTGRYLTVTQQEAERRARLKGIGMQETGLNYRQGVSEAGQNYRQGVSEAGQNRRQLVGEAGQNIRHASSIASNEGMQALRLKHDVFIKEYENNEMWRRQVNQHEEQFKRLLAQANIDYNKIDMHQVNTVANLAAQYGYDISKMDKAQEHKIMQLAEEQGHRVSMAEINQTNALTRMAKQYGFDINILGQKQRFDKDQQLRKHMHEMDMLEITDATARHKANLAAGKPLTSGMTNQLNKQLALKFQSPITTLSGGKITATPKWNPDGSFAGETIDLVGKNQAEKQQFIEYKGALTQVSEELLQSRNAFGSQDAISKAEKLIGTFPQYQKKLADAETKKKSEETAKQTEAAKKEKIRLSLMDGILDKLEAGTSEGKSKEKSLEVLDKALGRYKPEQLKSSPDLQALKDRYDAIRNGPGIEAEKRADIAEGDDGFSAKGDTRSFGEKSFPVTIRAIKAMNKFLNRLKGNN